MASNIDERQMLRWFTSIVTALTSSASSGGGTTSIAAMVTSIANQVTADTGLSTQEVVLVTKMGGAFAATTPSSTMASIL